jgi:outer membrane protein TolC
MMRQVARLWRLVGLAAVLAASGGSVASGQGFGGGGGGGGGTTTALVPLSGRQVGGATATASQAPAPAGGASVETLRSSVVVQGAYLGSRRPTDAPALGTPLSLNEAVRRGVEYNLGVLNLGQSVAQARGQRVVARSALLPSVSSEVSTTRQQINLSALGVRFTLPPGFPPFPTVADPFNQVDVRVRVTQALFDRVAWNNLRAVTETARAAELSAQDANDVVVLAVAGTYLEASAARARVEAVRAQLDTATALFRQASQRRDVGLVAQVDVSRAEVQTLTQQQRLTTAQHEYAKQKMALARMVGLPPTDAFELGQDVPFASAPAASLEESLKRARDTRADLQAALAQVRAAERARDAAHAERLPSATLSADYGALGNSLTDARATYSVVGRVRVPIWQGGRAGGIAQQADAAVRQRQAELADLESQVESEVRRAYLDIAAAGNQVTVATRNREVAAQTLELTRQRFEAGVSDNIEVVQAQEAAAAAALDHINSVFAHNLAKVSLARSLGVSAERLAEFLTGP